MEPSEILVRYQKELLNDKNPLRAWEKSRRIGASFVLALEAVLDGMGRNGSDTWYISYNLDMTKQFIEDCKYWAKALQLAADYFEEEVIDENNKTFKVYSLVFVSGFQVSALPSTE